MFGRRNKCQLNAKLSELYTIETLDSLIYLYERGNYPDCVDVYALDASATGIDKDPMALHLGYYD